MPDTPLTEILKDFRSYRPDNHREFLEWVRDRAGDVRVKSFAMAEEETAGKHYVARCHANCADFREIIALYLHALHQVRDFRWRHWCFTREYIIKKTSHPTATGGSPIVLVKHLSIEITAVLTCLSSGFRISSSAYMTI